LPVTARQPEAHDVGRILVTWSAVVRRAAPAIHQQFQGFARSLEHQDALRVWLGGWITGHHEHRTVRLLPDHPRRVEPTACCTVVDAVYAITDPATGCRSLRSSVNRVSTALQLDRDQVVPGS